MEKPSFFDRLFEGKVNWAFHTTMTCDLAYAMQLAYKLVGKDIYKYQLTKDDKEKTAVFYNKDVDKGRVLGLKGSGRKKKFRDYLDLCHAVCSGNQTFHAKISLVSYNEEGDKEDRYRLAVYSKNCEFNEKCAESAIILNLKKTEKETESGKNLVRYIKYVKDHLEDSPKKPDEEAPTEGFDDATPGSKWTGKHLTKEVYEYLEKCKFTTESGREAEVYFGGIPVNSGVCTKLNDQLHIESFEDDSIVLTPPEFIRGTEAQKFFENTQILYDLNSKTDYSSSHIKLYLKKAKNGSGSIDYELWTGSANATVRGLGWSFNNNNTFTDPQSVECLVKIPLNEGEFEKIKGQIREKGYEKFEDFQQKEGSLKKITPDDFGPWICENMEVKSICYYDSLGKPCGCVKLRGNADKIRVELRYKTNRPQTTIPQFKSIMCWRPAEYQDMQNCIVSNNSFVLEYNIEGFRPSQGILCFGTSQAIMQIDGILMSGIPQIEETKEMDTRVSDVLLSENSAISTDDLEHTPNEGIDWFYEITHEEERKLPCKKCSEEALKTAPMEFQKNAAVRLREILKNNDRAFLADEPGLGKTYSATKLICDMAAENGNGPFYVIYVAPNQSLLQKNGEEILSKAGEGLLENGWEIHMLSEYMSGKNLFIKAYEKCIDQRIKEIDEKIAKLINIQKIRECTDKKITFEMIAKEVAQGDTNKEQKLIGAYNDIKQNKKNPSYNYHKIFKAIKIGDGSGSSKNRELVGAVYAKAYKSIKIRELERKKKLYEQAPEMLEKKNDALFESYSGRKRIVESIKNECKIEINWNEFKEQYETVKFPDRLAYAYEILKNNTINQNSIILITVSQGCLFEAEGTQEEKDIIKNCSEEEIKVKTRVEFTEWFLKQYKPGLIIWDEYHRYLGTILDAINNKSQSPFPFLENGIKNLFVSATPYKTNISGDENQKTIEKLYKNVSDDRDDDDRDDKEPESMESLPSFDDFAELFCGNPSCEDMINSYKDFNNNPQGNKQGFEEKMKTKMVRHERSRLQKEHEIHIRKYPAADNVGEDFRIPFKNTINQSHLLEKAGYPEGARKWSLSLPWILDFSTKDKKAKNTDGESNYFTNLKLPKNSTNSPDDALFVYKDDGTVKDSIRTLPVQNLAFYQICKENAFDRMRQLLWVPPTAPLYSPGNGSIFSIYASYSKLLVFAEYRYLQRGGSRLLSDYIRYENTSHCEEVPQGFPVSMNWTDSIEDLERFDLIRSDNRDLELDALIQKIRDEEQFKDWTTAKILAAVASPAMCAKRLDLDPGEIENAFNDYFKGEGKKEALWGWICENGYKERWEEGILRYCAEGNLYAVLEEWLFVLKKEDKKSPTDQICERLRYEGSKVFVQTKETSEKQTEGKAGQCSFAEQLTGDVNDVGTGQNADVTLATANAFSSPLWPMVMFAGRGAQEGIDFHEYCLRIMHLTLPRGAVSYEQRNGRIDRFRSLLVRRRVAEFYRGYGIEDDMSGLLEKMFAKAILTKEELGQQRNELFPNWHFHIGKSKWNFEELIPMWNYTSESSLMAAYDNMLKSYRGSLGMNSTMNGDEGIDLSAPPVEK